MFNNLQRWFGNGLNGILELLITAFCVLLSLSIHETAHGYAAHLLGDDTAKSMGRLSLNPKAHLDPIGAICLFLFGFGWANPVPVNPRNFDKVSMKSGMVITSFAGPLANIITAFISMILMRFMRYAGGGIWVFPVYTILSVLISMNISLAVFNLIPVPPLDGYKVLSAVLPPRYYFKLMQYERYGFIVLLLIIYLRPFNYLLSSAVSGIYSLLDMVLNIFPF
mgnify:CR=1 FL=1